MAKGVSQALCNFHLAVKHLEWHIWEATGDADLISSSYHCELDPGCFFPVIDNSCYNYCGSKPEVIIN